MRPVEAYVKYLRREIRAVRAVMGTGIKMSRLHLGGGTPTILSAHTMADLLDDVFKRLTRQRPRTICCAHWWHMV